VHNIRELLVSEGFQPKDMAPNAGKSSFKVISCSKCTRVLTLENVSKVILTDDQRDRLFQPVSKFSKVLDTVNLYSKYIIGH
jgi:hypothetical protein